MDGLAGKHQKNENESNRKRQNQFSSSCKRGEKHQRLLNETFEQNETPSTTTLYNPPMEVLDIILQKSYLHWISNSSTKQRDEDVIKSLISVDVCFNRRITRQRFKKAIWRHLEDLYGKIKKRPSIIRNNRNYLLENIQPNDEFITSLVSLNCITKEQSHLIQRQRLQRDKNDELLHIMRSFDDIQFSNVVKCLRQTNQRTVAKIIDNGGVVIKMQFQTRDLGQRYATPMETQLQELHQKLEGLRNGTKPISNQNYKLIGQLDEEDIEILNSYLHRETLVVWIWCRSQLVLEHIQRLLELNQLRDRPIFFETTQLSTSDVVDIDMNQFKQTVVVFAFSVNFTNRIKLQVNEDLYGVTKLRNEIHVLCRSYLSSPYELSSFQNVIRVYEDRNPFRLQKRMEITEFDSPVDIVSSEKDNCLYVSDSEAYCVWKIAREAAGDQHTIIIRWLITNYQPSTLSVSGDGQLLILNESSSILNTYGSDAERIRSIQLPREIENPLNAVETSIGNFIITHWYLGREEDNGNSGSSGRARIKWWGMCELTKNGQLVSCRFIPSKEIQKIRKNKSYLSLDSHDRVFVADQRNGRVILLDFDLKWNRILCPAESEKEETKIQRPWRLFYDEEKKQLIVGGYLGEEVNVYTLCER